MLKQFIADLGGPEFIAKEVAKMSDRAPSKRAVYQWPYDGTIPHRWRYFVAKLAKKRRIPKDQVPDEVRSFMQ